MYVDPTRQPAAPAPKRLAAVGGAALISVLTVGGALGLVPGAAMGQQSHAARGGGQTTTATGPSGASGPVTGSKAERNADDWLTIDEGPSRSHESSAGSDEAPAVPAESGEGKRVVFDMSAQRVWLVDSEGDAERTYLVSGSKHDNLEPGDYEVYSTSRHAVSYDHKETMGYMVRFATGENAPIGFHDVPRRPDGELVQTRDQLGTPLSAGCIRQWIGDAKALWAFAPVGTEVVVVE